MSCPGKVTQDETHLQGFPALLYAVQLFLISISPHPYPVLPWSFAVRFHVDTQTKQVVEVPWPVRVNDMQVTPWREIKVRAQVEERTQAEENKSVQLGCQRSPWRHPAATDEY